MINIAPPKATVQPTGPGNNKCRL